METRYSPLQWIHYMTRGNALVLSCCMVYIMIAPCHKNNGDLKIRRQWRQRERHKSNRFKKQNNNFARVSHLFVQFFAVFSLLRREKSLISCFIEDVKVILRGTIFSATRTALKHCCDVVSKGCSVVPAFEPCVALKIVVANRLV